MKKLILRTAIEFPLTFALLLAASYIIAPPRPAPAAISDPVPAQANCFSPTGACSCSECLNRTADRLFVFQPQHICTITVQQIDENRARHLRMDDRQLVLDLLNDFTYQETQEAVQWVGADYFHLLTLDTPEGYLRLPFRDDEICFNRTWYKGAPGYFDPLIELAENGSKDTRRTWAFD